MSVLRPIVRERGGFGTAHLDHHDMIKKPGTVASFESLREPFVSWLTGRGSEILKPTNDYELLRFTGPTNICVIYRDGKKQIKPSHWVNGADVAWVAFATNGAWRAADRTIRVTRRDWRLVEDIAHRDGWSCVFCGGELTCETATIEHFVPLASGGPDNISNRMLACEPCNVKAGHKSAREKIEMAVRNRAATIVAAGELRETQNA